MGSVEQVVAETLANQGGTWFGDLTSFDPQFGYVVSIAGHEQAVLIDYFTPEVVTAYMRHNALALADAGNLLGTWVENDVIYLDISKHLTGTKAEAQEFAKANHQRSFWDVVNARVVYTDEERTPVISAMNVTPMVVSWAQLDEWANAPSNTASAHLPSDGQNGTGVTYSSHTMVSTDNKDFTPFFTDATQGMYAPAFQPQYQFANPEHQQALATWQSHSGNFDTHIDTSIPDYRGMMMRTAVAVAKTFGANSKVMDIGGAEGSWAKTVAQLGGGQTYTLDPNKAMESFSVQKSHVPGHTHIPLAFGQGFVDDDGTEYEAYQSPTGYDAIMESMTFQFISNDRDTQIAEAKRLLKPEGLLITAEKVITNNYAEGELGKDLYKQQFYTPMQLAQKQDVVNVQGDPATGMMSNMVTEDTLIGTLESYFQSVQPFWSSYNFKGYLASDSAETLQNFLRNYDGGDVPKVTPMQKVAMEAEQDWTPADSHDGNHYYKWLYHEPTDNFQVWPEDLQTHHQDVMNQENIPLMEQWDPRVTATGYSSVWMHPTEGPTVNNDHYGVLRGPQEKGKALMHEWLKGKHPEVNWDDPFHTAATDEDWTPAGWNDEDQAWQDALPMYGQRGRPWMIKDNVLHVGEPDTHHDQWGDDIWLPGPGHRNIPMGKIFHPEGWEEGKNVQQYGFNRTRMDHIVRALWQEAVANGGQLALGQKTAAAPQAVMSDFDAANTMHPSDAWVWPNSRHPVVWDPESNTAYVGPIGSHHEDLRQHHEINRYNSHIGELWLGSDEPVHRRQGSQPYLRWISPFPGQAQVHGAIETLMDQDLPDSPPAPEDPNDWTVAKVAADLPQVVESDASPYDSIYAGRMFNDDPSNAGWKRFLNRRALLYHPESNMLYIGRPGVHHEDLVKHHQIPPFSHTGNAGGIDLIPGAYPRFYWYANSAPGVEDRVRQAAAQLYPEINTFEPPKDPNDWTVAKVAGINEWDTTESVDDDYDQGLDNYETDWDLDGDINLDFGNSLPFIWQDGQLHMGQPGELHDDIEQRTPNVHFLNSTYGRINPQTNQVKIYGPPGSKPESVLIQALQAQGFEPKIAAIYDDDWDLEEPVDPPTTEYFKWLQHPKGFDIWSVDGPDGHPWHRNKMNELGYDSDNNYFDNGWDAGSFAIDKGRMRWGDESHKGNPLPFNPEQWYAEQANQRTAAGEWGYDWSIPEVGGPMEQLENWAKTFFKFLYDPQTGQIHIWGGDPETVTQTHREAQQEVGWKGQMVHGSVQDGECVVYLKNAPQQTLETLKRLLETQGLPIQTIESYDDVHLAADEWAPAMPMQVPGVDVQALFRTLDAMIRLDPHMTLTDPGSQAKAEMVFGYSQIPEDRWQPLWQEYVTIAEERDRKNREHTEWMQKQHEEYMNDPKRIKEQQDYEQSQLAMMEQYGKLAMSIAHRFDKLAPDGAPPLDFDGDESEITNQVVDDGWQWKFVVSAEYQRAYVWGDGETGMYDGIMPHSDAVEEMYDPDDLPPNIHEIAGLGWIDVNPLKEGDPHYTVSLRSGHGITDKELLHYLGLSPQEAMVEREDAPGIFGYGSNQASGMPVIPPQKLSKVIVSSADVLAHYLSDPTNQGLTRRLENMTAFTNHIHHFEKKMVKVAGLGWERFKWSDEAKARSDEFASRDTLFPTIILNPLGLVQDGAHRVRAAELRGDRYIEAYVPAFVTLGGFFPKVSVDVSQLAAQARQQLLNREDVLKLKRVPWGREAYDPRIDWSQWPDVNPTGNEPGASVYDMLKITLVDLPDEGFKLFPWIVREFKKGASSFGFRGTPEGIGPGGGINYRNGAHARDILQNAVKWMVWSKEHNQPIPDMMSKTFGFPQLEAWTYKLDNERASEDGWQDSYPVYTWPDGWHMDVVGSADLALEGKLMGHCVGGYCDVVDRGNSTIVSLRDPKGMPHVTIEFEGDKAKELQSRPEDVGADEGTQSAVLGIVQIQGKQDTRPIPEYQQRVDEWLDHLRSAGWETEETGERDPEPGIDYTDTDVYEPNHEGITHFYHDMINDPWRLSDVDEDPQWEDNIYYERQPNYIGTHTGEKWDIPNDDYTRGNGPMLQRGDINSIIVALNQSLNMLANNSAANNDWGYNDEEDYPKHLAQAYFVAAIHVNRGYGQERSQGLDALLKATDAWINQYQDQTRPAQQDQSFDTGGFGRITPKAVLEFRQWLAAYISSASAPMSVDDKGIREYRGAGNHENTHSLPTIEGEGTWPVANFGATNPNWPHGSPNYFDWLEERTEHFNLPGTFSHVAQEGWAMADR